MVSRMKGSVRKKSNQSPLERAATAPASRSPVAAAATMHSTSTSTALAAGTLPRKPVRVRHTTSGARTAAARTTDVDSHQEDAD